MTDLGIYVVNCFFRVSKEKHFIWKILSSQMSFFLVSVFVLIQEKAIKKCNHYIGNIKILCQYDILNKANNNIKVKNSRHLL